MLPEIKRGTRQCASSYHKTNVLQPRPDGFTLYHHERKSEPMAEPIEFDTERQRLAADYGPFAALNADSRVMQFFPAPLDRIASDAMAMR
jgi:hypothetical protein